MGYASYDCINIGLRFLQGGDGQHSALPIQWLGAGAVRGRELTLLGKWAIVLDNYLLVNYYGISTECVGEHVEVAVYSFLLLLKQRSV